MYSFFRMTALVVGQLVLLGFCLYIILFVAALAMAVVMPMVVLVQFYGGLGLLAVIMGWSGYKVCKNLL